MTISNTKVKGSGRATIIGRRKDDTRTEYARLGWEHARQGKPFDYNLVDSIHRVQGMSYELYRTIAIGLKARKIRVYHWDEMFKNKIPNNVNECIKNWYTAKMHDLDNDLPNGEKGWKSNNPDWDIERDSQIAVY